MKHIVLTIFLMSIIAGVALAQPLGHGPGKAGWQEGPRGNPAARLTEVLGLDESQVSQVEVIFEEARTLHEEQREKSDESFCAVRAATHARVVAVLNEEQRVLFDEHRLKQQGTQRAGRKGMRGERGNREGSKRQGRGPGRSSDRPGPPDCDL